MPTDLIAALDAADATPAATRLRARTYHLLRTAPGAHVADIGCGTGRAVAELAARGVRTTGIDLDHQMIEAARTRHPDADLRVADARALPFRDAELTGYRADKVLHNLPAPAHAHALAEARRVLAPGGRIVLCGQDWDTLVIDSAFPDLTRTLVHARADEIPSPRAARQYRGLLLDAGFQDVAVEVHTAVFTDAAVLPLLTRLAEPRLADDWLADQQERTRTNRLFVALPLFLASATNP
ncbi:methyltransferase domain-containing protein [Actinomadura montaniterrae]|uniref:Methyltransferase domain-containing protein n=1 Tax=Actinomadura montaniterrae TaxID=1803903 RepID=A0A6L3VQS6_9ACTN|nr:methyltransferase domain-containing protein [Actinomadura montaniterrae]KAB2374351.1 methyltransferase domain-containing protein [Actinomadura montaniterrae]